MPSVMIPDDVYAKLEAKAVEVHATVDEVIRPYLEKMVEPRLDSQGTGPLTGEAWQKAFDEMMQRTRNRATKYPPGYQADCSREWLYYGENGESDRGLV